MRLTQLEILEKYALPEGDEDSWIIYSKYWKTWAL